MQKFWTFKTRVSNYTGLVSDVEIPGNPKYRESRKAKKNFLTHGLTVEHMKDMNHICQRREGEENLCSLLLQLGQTKQA